MFRFLAFTVSFFLATSAIAEIKFPELTSDDLNGRSMNLPADLPGETTIIFVAYKQRQQPKIDAWVKRLGLTETGGPAWVEMPVVGKGAAIFRSFVDNGMRSGITSQKMRARTITIYSSRSAFNRAMGLKGRNDIYVLLVDRDGSVREIIRGDVSEEKVDQLRDAYPLQWDTLPQRRAYI